MPTDVLKDTRLHELLDKIQRSKSGKVIEESIKELDLLGSYFMFLYILPR